MTPPIRKAYADVAGRQIHYRTCGNGAPPLLCLAPAPFSGLAFANILPLLGEGREAVAPDYPGYGGSDPMGGSPSISTYADAMLEFAETKFPGERVDLLGFHSGCLVAVEMALRCSHAIRNIVLIDVPVFLPDVRRDFRKRIAQSAAPGEDLQSLESQWDRAVVSRKETQPLAQRLALFAEFVRSGDALGAMFEAAFDYDAEKRLPELDHPLTIIATKGSLLQPSHRAAKLLPKSRLIERQDIAGSVLDAHAEETAHTIMSLLETP